MISFSWGCRLSKIGVRHLLCSKYLVTERRITFREGSLPMGVKPWAGTEGLHTGNPVWTPEARLRRTKKAQMPG